MRVVMPAGACAKQVASGHECADRFTAREVLTPTGSLPRSLGCMGQLRRLRLPAGMEGAGSRGERIGRDRTRRLTTGKAARRR